MGRRLKLSVVIGSELHEAGSEPPAEVAKHITNPDAWEDEPEKAAPKRAAAKSRDEQ